MAMSRHLIVCALVIVAAACAVQSVAAEEPETVMITLRAKKGSERPLTDVLARHYETARRLDLVTANAPHVTLRSIDEEGKPYFIEILTWRDGAIPDHAPPEIVEIWKEMSALV